MKSLAFVAVLPILAIGLGGAGVRPKMPLSPFRVVITGNSSANLCSRHAKLVADGMMSPSYAVETCTEALQVEDLSNADTAATHNNRGVVLLGMADGLDSARSDFFEAAKIMPELGESYVNQGAVLLAEGKFADAISIIEKGMALGLREPWKAHYNRAVARENTGDVRGAYADYMRATELNPGWEPPTLELARFQVRTPAR